MLCCVKNPEKRWKRDTNRKAAAPGQERDAGRLEGRVAGWVERRVHIQGMLELNWQGSVGYEIRKVTERRNRG